MAATTQALESAHGEKQETCPEHGPFTSTAMQLSKFGLLHWSHCPGCEGKREATREAERLQSEAAEKAEAFASRLRSADIPQRFAGKTFASFEAKTPEQKNVLQVAKDFVHNFEANYSAGRCLIFLGSLGTGKTLLGCAILRGIIERPFLAEGVDWRNAWHPVRYTTVAEAIRSIRATWRRKSEVSEADAIAKYVRPHLLLLDEVAAQYGSDAERTQVEEILDLRYREMRPTAICSNASKSELPQFLGARGCDRLSENKGIVATFPWPSRRGGE
jgi:DNA replication protein DnaC